MILPLMVIGVLLAGALVSRAVESSPMPLEQHEQHQKGTDLLFGVFLVVAAAGAALLALAGAQ